MCLTLSIVESTKRMHIALLRLKQHCETQHIFCFVFFLNGLPNFMAFSRRMMVIESDTE